MYHQFGSCGGNSVWEPVFTRGAHSGDVIWSTFSFRYLASFSINTDGGTSYGVGKAFAPWFFLQ